MTAYSRINFCTSVCMLPRFMVIGCCGPYSCSASPLICQVSDRSLPDLLDDVPAILFGYVFCSFIFQKAPFICILFLAAGLCGPGARDYWLKSSDHGSSDSSGFSCCATSIMFRYIRRLLFVQYLKPIFS